MQETQSLTSVESSTLATIRRRISSISSVCLRAIARTIPALEPKW
ncbi:hypothetical protein [Nocardiopsis sp. JB363]